MKSVYVLALAGLAAFGHADTAANQEALSPATILDSAAVKAQGTVPTDELAELSPNAITESLSNDDNIVSVDDDDDHQQQQEEDIMDLLIDPIVATMTAAEIIHDSMMPNYLDPFVFPLLDEISMLPGFAPDLIFVISDSEMSPDQEDNVQSSVKIEEITDDEPAADDDGQVEDANTEGVIVADDDDDAVATASAVSDTVGQ